MNIVYEVVENFGVVPVIECLEHKDLINLPLKTIKCFLLV